MAKPIMESLNSQENVDWDRIWQDDRINGDPNRDSPEEANYVDAAKGKRTCGDCMYYQPRVETMGTCIKVTGVIRPGGHCTYWVDAESGIIENKKKEVSDG